MICVNTGADRGRARTTIDRMLVDHAVRFDAMAGRVPDGYREPIRATMSPLSLFSAQGQAP